VVRGGAHARHALVNVEAALRQAGAVSPTSCRPGSTFGTSPAGRRSVAPTPRSSARSGRWPRWRGVRAGRSADARWSWGDGVSYV